MLTAMTHDAPPITLSKPSELPGSPMSSVIGWDQPCLVCGYNLKHLALRDSCPECGTTVNFAIRRTRLVYQPLPWIRRLRLGAMLALVGSVLSVLLILAMAPTLAFGSMLSMDYPFWFGFALPAIGALGVSLLASGMLLLSWGAPPGCKRRVLAERMTRSASALVLLAAVVIAMLTVIHRYEQISTSNAYGYYSPSTGYTYGIIAIAWVLGILAFPFMFFPGIVQLRLLASLIPSPRSVRQTWWTFWLTIGNIGAFVIVYTVQIMLFVRSSRAQLAAYNANPNGPYPDDPWYEYLPLYIMLAIIIGSVLQVCWMFFRLRLDLSTVAAEAVKIRTDQERVDAEP